MSAMKLVIALFLVACGGGSKQASTTPAPDPASGADATPVEATPVETPAADPMAAPAEGAAPGGGAGSGPEAEKKVRTRGAVPKGGDGADPCDGGE